MKKYDCIFSFGEACLCASILSKLGLRLFSSPFDWMFGATFEERMNLLLNDFENFLNKEDMSFVCQRNKPEPCDIYLNNRTNICFNHDFPLNVALDTSFPNVKAKYERRIKRLLDTIKNSKSVLLVFMELPNSDKKASVESLINLMEKINSKFNGPKIDVLYIKHDEDMKDRTFSIESISENITIGACFNRKRNSQINYSGNYKNVRLLFKDIRTNSSRWDMFKYRIRKYLHKLKKILKKTK